MLAAAALLPALAAAQSCSGSGSLTKFKYFGGKYGLAGMCRVLVANEFFCLVNEVDNLRRFYVEHDF